MRHKVIAANFNAFIVTKSTKLSRLSSTKKVPL